VIAVKPHNVFYNFRLAPENELS